MIDRTQKEIMQNWLAESNAPLVTIRCLAYNHEQFIERALDGFLMQETKYPFEIVIHDDASTDKTADIIRKYEEKYPEIIKAVYERENQHSKGGGSVAKIVNPLCRGKYIAYCEGDDYWTYPQKIEEQVDILEKNSDVFLVHSDFETVDEHCDFIERRGYNKFKFTSVKENGLVSLFKKNHIMTLTVIIRREVLFNSMYVDCPYHYDYALFFAAAFMGKIRYVPKIMGAYRKHSNSAMQSRNKQVSKKMKQVYLYYVNCFFRMNDLFSKKDILLINYSVVKKLLSYRDYRYLAKMILGNPLKIFLLPIAFFHLGFLHLRGET